MPIRKFDPAEFVGHSCIKDTDTSVKFTVKLRTTAPDDRQAAREDADLQADFHNWIRKEFAGAGVLVLGEGYHPHKVMSAEATPAQVIVPIPGKPIDDKLLLMGAYSSSVGIDVRQTDVFFRIAIEHEDASRKVRRDAIAFLRARAPRRTTAAANL